MESKVKLCPKCRIEVKELGINGTRLECGHYVHTKCLGNSPDFVSCDACKGLVNMELPVFDPSEPDAYNGRDYVNQPLADSFFNQFSNLFKRGEPFTWIRDGVPMEWMIKTKGFGLQRMIAAGVRLEDFLTGGYTWDHLKGFKAFANGDKDRGRKALMALKCNAEHFRDFRHLLGSMVTELDISPRNMVEMYGLCFPGNSASPMIVMGGKNVKPWLASDLIPLGFKYHNIYGAGLQYLEQYAFLQPSDEDELALGVTDDDIRRLPSYEEERRKAMAIMLRQQQQPAAAEPVEENYARPRYIEPIKVEVDPLPPKPRIHRLRNE